MPTAYRHSLTAPETIITQTKDYACRNKNHLLVESATMYAIIGEDHHRPVHQLVQRRPDTLMFRKICIKIIPNLTYLVQFT